MPLRIKMRKMNIFILGAILIISGCSFVTADSDRAPDLWKPAQMKIKTVQAVRGDIVSQLNGVAVVTPADVEYEHFLSGGTLDDILVQRGDYVQKGDLLIRLVKGDLDLQIAQQELNVERASNQVNIAKSEQDPDQVKIQVMNYQIEQLKLEDLRNRLASKSMFADRGGLVTFIETLKHGDSVYAYRDMIGITDPNRWNLTYIAKSSADIYNMPLGQSVQLFANGENFFGEIMQTPATAPYDFNATTEEADLHSRTLLIHAADPPGEVRLGQMVTFTVDLEKKEDVIIIPRGALNQYQGRSFVYVADEDSGNFKEVSVTHGIITATEAEIDSGLQAGQRVMISN